MDIKEYAIIDIGSNSVRYLGRGGKKLLTTTRLASGLVDTQKLGEEPMQKSIDAISRFAALAREEGLIPRAYATSAVRDAVNSGDFTGMASRECGIEIDVLSGEREAEYALLGAGIPGGALIDIGGGSSQLVTADYRASWPMGCVRAKDICWDATSLSDMRDAVFARCRELYRFPRFAIRRFTGVGGTITTLAALAAGLGEYDAAAVCAQTLTQPGVEGLTERLYAMGDAARANTPLLHDRHDVIIPGALVLLFIMRGMGVYELAVSDADGMEGYRIYLENIE